MKKTPTRLASLVTVIAVLTAGSLFANPPELTKTDAIAALKTDPNSLPVYGQTYNLGATGLRGCRGWACLARISSPADIATTERMNLPRSIRCLRQLKLLSIS